MPLAASPPAVIRDARLLPLCEKVRTGRRLTRDEGLLLFQTDDLHAVGRMADFAKFRLHGDRVFFVMNRYDNPTTVRVL